MLEAFVHRGQKLLPELQTGLSQLQFTLDTIRARSRTTGVLQSSTFVLCLHSACTTDQLHGRMRSVEAAGDN
jgi:hypothetical protein